MGYANGAEVRRAYVAETTFGVTPATPSFKPLRGLGSLQTDKGTVVLDEVQADGNVRDELMVSQDVNGSYNGEFHAESWDDFIAGALRGAWATNVLKNGVLRPSFTCEETTYPGGVANYSRFRGVMVDTMSLSLPSRAKAAISFGLKGAQETLDSAIITGATYAAANTNQAATTSANVSNLTITGMTTPLKVKNLSIEVNNGLRIRDGVGSLLSDEFGADQRNITGTIEAYFESNDQYQAVLSHGLGTIQYTLGADAAKRYTILLPRVRWLNGKRNPGGKSDDAMLSIPFRAIFDPTEACSMKVTRAVA